MNRIFIAFDGDNVGSRLEYFMLTNDRATLQKFSSQFSSAMTWLENQLIQLSGAEIIFNGGDNLLATVTNDNDPLLLIKDIITEFRRLSSSTISVGVGTTMREAYFALKLAKTGGKNRICDYKDLT